MSASGSRLSDVEGCEVLGPHDAALPLQGRQDRDLPLTVAQLPIFSKAYYAQA